MKQTILRMENSDGVGPFEIGKYLEGDESEKYYYDFPKAVKWTYPESKELLLFGQVETWHQPKDHPHHERDTGNGGTEYDWKVGTKDQAQFDHWFPPESLPVLAEWGFLRAIYECDSLYIHPGQYQLLFCVTQANMIERKPLV